MRPRLSFICLLLTNFTVSSYSIAATSFFDDFSDGILDGWTVVGNATINSGHLRAGPGQGPNGASPTGLVVDNFVLAYKMNILSNSGTTETLFRTGPYSGYIPNTGYLFSFRNDLSKVELYKRNHGWSILQSTIFPHTLNTWYSVKIEVLGSSIRAFIDGIPVANVVDTSFTSGDIRLAAWQDPVYGWTNEQVLFDDVRITSIPVPEPAAYLLFGTGLICLLGFRLARNK